MAAIKQFQFIGEPGQLAILHRAKIFSWGSKKRQQSNNQYQQYLTSHLLLNSKSFSWDAAISSGLLKPPKIVYLLSLSGLILIFLADNFQQSSGNSDWSSFMKLPAWLLIVYAGIELWIHQQKQTINPLRYDDVDFHFTASATGFLKDVVFMPTLLLIGAWVFYRYIDIPRLYKVAIIELLIISIIPIALYLRDRFKIQSTHYGNSAFRFHATLTDYFKYQLKLVFILMLVSELMIIYFYSMEALGHFNIDQYTSYFSIGFFILLLSMIVYAVIEMKIDYKNLLINNTVVNGCQLKSSIQAKAFFHQAYHSIQAFIESIDKPNWTLSQQLKLLPIDQHRFAVEYRI